MEDGKTIINKAFRELLQISMYQFRKRYEFTQERMAEVLHITPRCYLEQEHGRYGLSALSFTYFILAMDEEERKQFFEQCAMVLEVEIGKVEIRKADNRSSNSRRYSGRSSNS